MIIPKNAKQVINCVLLNADRISSYEDRSNINEIFSNLIFIPLIHLRTVIHIYFFYIASIIFPMLWQSFLSMLYKNNRTRSIGAQSLSSLRRWKTSHDDTFTKKFVPFAHISDSMSLPNCARDSRKISVGLTFSLIKNLTIIYVAQLRQVLVAHLIEP